MLNYWRTTAGTEGDATTFLTGNSRPTANNTLLPSDYGFDGPFFDLDFASETTETNLSETDSDEEMREIELNLDVDDQDFKISPSHLFNTPEENSKLPAALLKSADKFRVLLFKLKKKGEKSEKIEAGDNNEVLRVKLKVDEVKGPLISLFARDITMSEDSTTNSGKEMLQKYLNILKPLYVRVEKMRLHGGAVSPPPAMAKAGVRSNNLQAGLKVVRKHLGKSRSTPAAPASTPPPPGSNRRDDSLLEVQAGIQGAIQHCKRSFNSNREGESAVFCRSVSNPYCEKSVISSASHPEEAIDTGV